MSVFRHGKRPENVSFSANVTAGCFAVICGLVAGQSAVALDVVDCDRITHVSHGGAADHQDLGDGRVMWRDWWSQEGTAEWISVVDCAPGTALRVLTQEENMGTRLPMNRTEAVIDVIERHESGARVFAALERVASDLEGIARDITLTTLDAEPCACAALYPEARGDKTEFKLAG